MYAPASSHLEIDETLLAGLQLAAREALAVAGVEPTGVGISSLPASSRAFTVVTGLAGGGASGMVSLNLSEPSLLYLAGQLLCEERTVIDDEVLETATEIGGLVGGRLREHLSGGPWQLKVTCEPALVFGESYKLHVAPGLQVVTLDFVLPGTGNHPYEDRSFALTLALRK